MKSLLDAAKRAVGWNPRFFRDVSGFFQLFLLVFFLLVVIAPVMFLLMYLSN